MNYATYPKRNVTLIEVELLNFAFTIMSNRPYFIALVLLIIWIEGFLLYHIGGYVIHIFLILAIIIFFYRLKAEANDQ